MSLPTDDKARKALPIWSFLLEYFPDAQLAVVDVAVKGNDQHNPGQPLHWARGKSTDQMNTAFRHMWDHGRGTAKDTDGAYHLAKAIWRLSAELQLTIEREREEIEPAGYSSPEGTMRPKRQLQSVDVTPAHGFPLYSQDHDNG